ncbi:unnamed protein product, partial [marine sediment metagenome]
MDLGQMIVPSKTVWCEYPGVSGFEVQLAHLTRDELMKLRSKSMNKKISRKTRGMEEEVDSELFQDLYISAVIKDWKGLKLKYLEKFFPVNIGAQDPEELLDFTDDNARSMMK